ncbi:GTPase [Roseibacillus ishigakijimensis]|uniref:50S ribosome-binding GTPase n=1 Tax=Roseibacillus ishigakijimensis TaxID=454146 RepID=A0A934VNB6_9BACT|nr:GTPase [Roseibacillus ishigakijimensis]MBK1834860.1 50S ribosome-binding GTPase [Roseibacillus ishigakijimensis]
MTLAASPSPAKENQKGTSPRPAPLHTYVVCGGESVGKTQLLASLTGKQPLPENYRGSTTVCETYRDGDLRWTDTPGLL